MFINCRRQLIPYTFQAKLINEKLTLLVHQFVFLIKYDKAVFDMYEYEVVATVIYAEEPYAALEGWYWALGEELVDEGYLNEIFEIEATLLTEEWLTSDYYLKNLFEPAQVILNINPSTNWLNIPVAGGSRTVTITTNIQQVSFSRPYWMTHQFVAGGFVLQAPVNNTPYVRTGIVSVFGGGITRSFQVSQLAGAANLTINPATNWTNIPAAGGTRGVAVNTNLSTFTVYRPAWINVQPTQNGFNLVATANGTISQRTGTVSVAGGGITRSFQVAQLAGAAILTINPSTNWTNVPAAGGTRTVTVTTNLPSFNVQRPAWINVQPTQTGFILTATPNNTTTPSSGVVSVTGGGITRSFQVTQLAATATLTISPTSDWTDIPATGGTRTVTVNTNLPSYSVGKPDWMTLQTTPGGFILTANVNDTTWQRAGEVRVMGGGVTRSFRVTQLGRTLIPVQCPPLADIQRGTAAQYLAMGIGWPLGDEFGNERRNLNNVGSSGFFGHRRDGGRIHIGIDISDPAGVGLIMRTPVLAVACGIVVDVLPWLYYYYEGSARRVGSGWRVVIRSTLPDPHPDNPYNLIFYYQHLYERPRFACGTYIRDWDIVSKGDQIGRVGNSGAEGTSRGHLHFEVSNYRNPWHPEGNRVPHATWHRVTRRVNPLFFFSIDAWVGATHIWNEIR